MAKKEEKQTLEEKFVKLEDTIKALEKDDVSLEDSFKFYQEGMKLLKECNEELDTVEKQVKLLNEQGECVGELQ